MHTGRDPNGILQTRCAGLEKCGIAPGPTSVPLPVGSVLSAPKLHWEPSPPARFSTALPHLCFYQHKDQRLHVPTPGLTPACHNQNKLYQRMPFLGAAMWAVWKVSLRNKFLPNPAQALGCWEGVQRGLRSGCSQFFFPPVLQQLSSCCSLRDIKSQLRGL